MNKSILIGFIALASAYAVVGYVVAHLFNMPALLCAGLVWGTMFLFLMLGIEVFPDGQN